MGNLNTRTYNRKARAKVEARERSERERERERLQELSEHDQLLERACKRLNYEIRDDGYDDEKQLAILNEYVILLDNLEDEMRQKFGELYGKNDWLISSERDRAITAIIRCRLGKIEPKLKPDADKDKDKFPFRSIG